MSPVGKAERYELLFEGAAGTSEPVGVVPCILRLASAHVRESVDFLALLFSSEDAGCLHADDYFLGLDSSLAASRTLVFRCEGRPAEVEVKMLMGGDKQDGGTSAVTAGVPFEWKLGTEAGLPVVEFTVPKCREKRSRETEWWHVLLKVKGGRDHSMVIMVRS